MLLRNIKVAQEVRNQFVNNVGNEVCRAPLVSMIA